MKYISRYAVLIIAFLGLTSVLPSLYRIAFADYAENRSVSYSPVIDDFTYVSHTKNIGSRYYDAAGNTYTKMEYFQLHPFVYAGNLARWGTYPGIVAGRYIPVEDVSRDMYYTGIKPFRSDIELNRVALYPLFESSGEFTRLELPNDLFRITDRMEFISGETRGVDGEKSVIFTEALHKAGFSFPAGHIFGNTNPKKDYDFGYFVIDADGDIFHIKMVNGKPYVHNTQKPEGINFEYISVEEDRADPSYGIFITDGGDAYKLEKDGYRYVRYNIGKINRKEQYLSIMGDPLYTYLTVQDKDYTELFVFDKEDNLYKSHRVEKISTLSKFFEDGYDTLFPFILRTHEPKSYTKHLYLELTENPAYAALCSVILALIYAGYMLFRRRSLRMTAVDSLFVAAGGFIPFVLLMIMGSERRR